MNCIRGKHAHYKTDQLLYCVSGRIEVTIDTVISRKTIILKSGDSLYHKKLEWAELRFIDAGSILLSACSTPFDPLDYIGDYNQYKNIIEKLEEEKMHVKLMACDNMTMDKLEVVPVPFLNLRASYQIIKTEVDEAIKDVLDSACYVNGPAVQDFELKWASYVNTKHCVGLTSGTDALLVAMEALGVGEGDEVILQGNAYIADALVVDKCGARMVLIDHDDSYQLDLNLIEGAITSRTKAILAVHMYGICCDMDRLVDICQRRGLFLIEDCAHAHGARWNDRCVGSFGDIGCWSFYPGKNLGAYGDAGACTTDSNKLADAIRLLKNYGSNRKYYNDSKGLNYRIDTLQAAVLGVKINYLNDWNIRRRQIADLYTTSLTGVEDISFPAVPPACVPVYHQFVIHTEHRDALLEWMTNKFKIGALIHYPVPIHRQQSFKNYASCAAHLPMSDSCCDRILSLPMCPTLTDQQVLQVVRVVKAFYFSINPGEYVSAHVKGKRQQQSELLLNDENAESTNLTVFTHNPENCGAQSSVRVLTHQIRDCQVGQGITIIEPTNLYECTLYDDVFVGPFVEIQSSVTIGARTRIQSHAFICEYVSIGSDCFVGHGAKFVNDLMKGISLKRSDREDKLLRTTIGNHVVIGTNATILPVNICDYVVVGAGSVVTKSITESGIYAGNPASRIGDFVS